MATIDVLAVQRGDLLAEVSIKATDTASALSSDDMEATVDAFLTVVDGIYAHLPLKRARYGVDPVQQLRLLRDRCATLVTDEFHAELSQIITGLRDAHTRYQGGESYAGKVAVLPFLAEAYGPPDDPHYLVSKTGPAELIGDANFVAGVELVSWSGIPFDRAVNRWADNETGGRPDARRARALESLTFRSLHYGPPPDELWVIVGYRSADGETREVRIPWRVVSPGEANTAVSSRTSRSRAATAKRRAAQAHLAVNPAAEAVRRAKQLLFAPDAWKASATRANVTASAPKSTGADRVIVSKMPDVLMAKVRSTAHGEVGHLRIWSFSVDDDEAFVREIIRLVDHLPDTGLIIDLRGNPGGLIWAAERALQLFTPNRITPTKFSWRATDLVRALAVADTTGDFSPWGDSLNQANSTGERYSQPLPLTDPDACNDIGQRYSGPVICVIDANTYSSGDLFAAGFADNHIGDILAVGQATGAGGANVWDDNDVRRVLASTAGGFPVLPGGIKFTVAVRRATRTGRAEATPIEDLGVEGTATYAMTMDDLVNNNRDLVDTCAARLADQPHSALRVTATKSKLQFTSSGLDVIDLYVDGHPWQTITKGLRSVERALPRNVGTIEVVGHAGTRVAQRRRIVH